MNTNSLRSRRAGPALSPILPELRIEPTQRLLLRALNGKESALDAEEFHHLDPSGWKALTQEAVRLQLGHALHHFLQRNPSLREMVPKFVIARLNQLRQANTLHNVAQAGQLLRVLKALELEGIPCLLMKGLWINEVLYRDMAARRSNDVDLLFHPHDMPRATQVFRRLNLGNLDSSIQDIRTLVPSSHEITLKERDSGVLFDIHWSMTRPDIERAIDESSFWKRSQTYTIAGIPCRSFSYEDHLLLLSYHTAEHHRFKYVGPRALLDLSQAFNSSSRPIDWKDLIERARQLGWDRGLALMLALVEEVTGVTLDPAAAKLARDERHMAQEIQQLAVESLILDMDHRDAVGNRLLKAWQRPSHAKRLGYVIERLFPAPALLLEYAGLTRDQVGSPLDWLALYAKRLERLRVELLPQLLDLLRNNPRRRNELKRSLKLQQWLDTVSGK